MTHAEFLMFLKEQGYTEIRLFDLERYAAVLDLMFTAAIIVGRVGDMTGYDNRWCYHSHEDAKKALEEWNGIDEPKGWHRHPATGRRRNENGHEYIMR